MSYIGNTLGKKDTLKVLGHIIGTPVEGAPPFGKPPHSLQDLYYYITHAYPTIVVSIFSSIIPI